MGSRAVLFAITDEEANALRSAESPEERGSFVSDTIEERYWTQHPELKIETDKAWDAIHRSLTDGRLEYENGAYPLSHVILGGELLCEDEYIISLKTREQVKDVAHALAGIDLQTLRNGYRAIDPEDYGSDLSDEDWEYTWGWFQDLPAFYSRAAELGRQVIFTVDQ